MVARPGRSCGRRCLLHVRAGRTDRLGRTPATPANGKEHQVGELLSDMMLPAFWIAVGQIIWINILLSGDNAVVIALACRSLPPRQRFWGIILGTVPAVVLRIIFAIFIAYLLNIPYLKFIGGLLLFWIAVKMIL